MRPPNSAASAYPFLFGSCFDAHVPRPYRTLRPGPSPFLRSLHDLRFPAIVPPLNAATPFAFATRVRSSPGELTRIQTITVGTLTSSPRRRLVAYGGRNSHGGLAPAVNV